MESIKRRLALLVYLVFAQHWPYWLLGKWGIALRGFLVRMLFAECGRNVRVLRRVKFSGGRTIHVGDNVGIGEDTIFSAGGHIYLGSDLKMGPRCTFITGDHGVRSKRPLSEQDNMYGDIRVGQDVFIGAQALILPGVTIGDGAVVGAGAVVAKDVPPYTIVAGNPAREIGKRE